MVKHKASHENQVIQSTTGISMRIPYDRFRWWENMKVFTKGYVTECNM